MRKMGKMNEYIARSQIQIIAEKTNYFQSCLIFLTFLSALAGKK